MFKRIDLPYHFDALEPALDAETMEVHYNGHYKTYTDRLNQLHYEGHDISNIDYAHNWGGWYNHGLFFSNLTPHRQRMPKFALSFRDAVQRLKNRIYGSGYVWLLGDSIDNLHAQVTANQHTPDRNLNPLVAIDLWEHAHYLKFKNNKIDYINALFLVIDWEKIQSQLR